ncbi:MAG: hypothetical protein HQ588_01640 [Deltaproteobacteria bacterium]|nr:hypothetical protein [Deltaproteobacteria bacterium]
MRYIAEHLNRARYIYRSEGAISLLKRLFSYLFSYIFSYEEYYVLHHFVGELNEAEFPPEDNDLTFKLITSNKMADDWAKRTGFDFRDQVLHARQRLDAGAVAFCVFIQNQLAHNGWVGLNQKSKNSIDPQPFRVNFSEHQGCVGGAETAPKFRNKGIMAYNWVHINNYMKEQGITMLTSIVATDNIAVYKAHTGFPSVKISAEARHIKFLWWQYWKETPLPEDFKLFG